MAVDENKLVLIKKKLKAVTNLTCLIHICSSQKSRTYLRIPGAEAIIGA